jgi:hypothetical protein
VLVSYYKPPLKELNIKELIRIINKIPYLNAKSIELGNKTTNKSGEDLVEFLAVHDGIILNNNEPTCYKGENGDRIDYAICSAEIFESISSCVTLKNSILLNDHIPIKTTIAIKSKQKENTEFIKSNKKTVINWKIFTAKSDNLQHVDNNEINEEQKHLVTGLTAIKAEASTIKHIHHSKHKRPLPIRRRIHASIRRRFSICTVVHYES